MPWIDTCSGMSRCAKAFDGMAWGGMPFGGMGTRPFLMTTWPLGPLRTMAPATTLICSLTAGPKETWNLPCGPM